VKIFVDREVNNLVYIVLVKLVPAKPGTCGFEVIQRRDVKASIENIPRAA
jgi:hypothetical protein